MDTKLRLGLRLKALRKSKNLTQDELAARIGRSIDALSNLERGKSLPSFATIDQLAKELEVPLKSLFDFQDTTFSQQKIQMIEDLQSIALTLPEADLGIALEQMRALGRRKPTSLK